MSIIVQKFGGSSVADVEKLRAVARKVVATKEAGHQVVVVVSAMGDTTDELLALARQINARPDRRELDMLLSVGERISMTLLSMGIQALGHDAISFTGSQVGIITNDDHANARIIDVRPFRIQDELSRGRIVIVAGYQGTSYKREVTTLGRGGSDMTAVALAGALGAEACEIYSDVDGVFTSDPRVVLDAQRLEAITADEMLELARHGARVLHADAVAWARRHRIALFAKKTHVEESKGTIVRPDGWPETALAAARIAPRGLASHEQVLWFEGQAPDDPVAFLERAAPGAEPLMWSLDAAAGATRALLDPTNCSGDVASALEGLREALGPDAVAHAEWSNITLVGQDIGRRAHWLGALQQALRTAGVAVQFLEARQHTLTALVPCAQRADAMRAAHTLVEPLDVAQLPTAAP